MEYKYTKDERLKAKEDGFGLCRDCGEKKVLSKFNKTKTKFGIDVICRSCRNDLIKRAYPNCRRCDKEFDTEVRRIVGSYNCSTCISVHNSEIKKYKEELLERRISKEYNDREVYLFVRKMELNGEKFSLYDINLIIDLFEYTFLTSTIKGDAMSEQILYMYDKLCKYVDKLDLPDQKKIVI